MSKSRAWRTEYIRKNQLHTPVRIIPRLPDWNKRSKPHVAPCEYVDKGPRKDTSSDRCANKRK